nr:hypothetical protein [Gellertiella hungarica]
MLLLTPGPTNTLLALAGTARRSRTGLCCMGAELAGYFTTVLPVHVLAAPVLAAHPELGRVVSAVAALWVLTLSIRLWGRSLETDATVAVTPRLVYVTTVLNPKGLVIALALLPGQPGADLYLCLVLMAVLIPAAALLWLSLGATAIRRLSERHPALIMRAASSALLFFAAGLAGKAAGLI